MTTIEAIPRPAVAGAPAAVRVLVISTQPLVGYGLRSLVTQTSDLAWCGAAPSAEKALPELLRLHPHVVLLDSRIDGDARGIHILRQAQPGVRVIGLVHDDQATAGGYLQAARAAQVNGLVSQSAAPTVLIAAIRTTHHERAFLDPHLAPLLTGSQAVGALPAQTIQLTPRQLEILTRIAHGLRNAEIADELGVSVETIRTHAKQIMHRLTALRAHAVARGYQLGLLPTPDTAILRPA
ncbi:response regulator transcription factor [Amycolatopsis sp. SID8362]|uniref:response regulator transcription factor n=1 Tax=Amycolatopsis sp. SID8362 TaxID=2690346 RepID=UPI00136BEEEA|nr:response regulator transcription factor [Amycolatopsis sp. SID8362]NBH02871.1 DNA-binding response regulator [Amycolatopsis sp. SID8362]NED39572.1 response regulator transcription factor [Amycolatopsis sp. SID8362]